MNDRRFPHIPFSKERLAPFLESKGELADWQLLSGGACNSNYLMTFREGEKLVARFYARGNPAVEQRLTNMVKDLIPVPESMWIGEGVAVMSYIKGEHLTASAGLLREAGRILGRLSQLSFPRSGQFTEEGDIRPFPWENMESGLMQLIENQQAQHLMGDELTRQIVDLIKRQRPVFESFDRERQLVHGDFRPDNILIEGDRIVGILDWEFSHSGSISMDIGNLLRHFPSSFDEHVASGLRDEGVELPPDWRDRAFLIDLGSHLEFLTSSRSLEFKRVCLDRIQRLLARFAGR